MVSYRYTKLLLLVSLSLPACGQVTGIQGPPGGNGTNGSNGQNGSAGIDGQSPTIVQFCQGTTHYPDTFCEVGFCFQNVLYATYSANDGFSSAIPDGSYSSNGINCSCAFTVSTGCQVTQ